MYKREKLINGVLHFQNTPNGEWHPYSLESLSERLKSKDSTLYELNTRMQEGRDYLMSTSSEVINAADALEAFGFGRNGLN